MSGSDEENADEILASDPWQNERGLPTGQSFRGIAPASDSCKALTKRRLRLPVMARQRACQGQRQRWSGDNGDGSASATSVDEPTWQQRSQSGWSEASAKAYHPALECQRSDRHVMIPGICGRNGIGTCHALSGPGPEAGPRPASWSRSWRRRLKNRSVPDTEAR